MLSVSQYYATVLILRDDILVVLWVGTLTHDVSVRRMYPTFSCRQRRPWDGPAASHAPYASHLVVWIGTNIGTGHTCLDAELSLHVQVISASVTTNEGSQLKSQIQSLKLAIEKLLI